MEVSTEVFFIDLQICVVSVKKILQDTAVMPKNLSPTKPIINLIIRLSGSLGSNPGVTHIYQKYNFPMKGEEADNGGGNNVKLGRQIDPNNREANFSTKKNVIFLADVWVTGENIKTGNSISEMPQFIISISLITFFWVPEYQLNDQNSFNSDKDSVIVKMKLIFK